MTGPIKPGQQVITLTGPPAQVSQRLGQAHAAGVLLWMTPPVPTEAGTVQVTAAISSAQAEPEAPELRTAAGRLPGWAKAVLGVASLAVLSGLGWALVTAIGWLTEVWPTVLGIALIFTVSAVAAYRVTACPAR